MANRVNFYADLALDRAAERRKEAGFLSGLVALETTRIVPVRKTGSFVIDGADRPAPLLLAASDLPEGADWTGVFLGLDQDGRAYIAAEIPDSHPVERLAPNVAIVDLRAVGPRLPASDAALLGYARGMLHWHARHTYCGTCGTPTRPEDAGHIRRCTSPTCGAVQFPRTDPVVIMLVTDGEHCLLGRQSFWPKGMYSALAGFVEPGETLEQAVAREVREEAGIEIGHATYHSSQPWPFPGSLMLGFIADAASRDIVRIDGELEDARWVSRADLIAGPEASGLTLPPPTAIARVLVNEWLGRGDPRHHARADRGGPK